MMAAEKEMGPAINQSINTGTVAKSINIRIVANYPIWVK